MIPKPRPNPARLPTTADQMLHAEATAANGAIMGGGISITTRGTRVSRRQLRIRTPAADWFAGLYDLYIEPSRTAYQINLGPSDVATYISQNVMWANTHYGATLNGAAWFSSGTYEGGAAGSSMLCLRRDTADANSVWVSMVLTVVSGAINTIVIRCDSAAWAVEPADGIDVWPMWYIPMSGSLIDVPNVCPLEGMRRSSIGVTAGPPGGSTGGVVTA